MYSLAKHGRFSERWKNGKIKPEEIKGLAEIMIEEGAGEYTENTADRLTKEALQILDQITNQDDPGNSLKELTTTLLSRKK